MSDERRCRITPQDLLGLALPLELDLSPEGGRVAFTLSEPDFAHGESHVQLHLAPDPDPPPAPPGEPPPAKPVRQVTFGLAEASAPAWSPDGRQLAFVTFRPQPHEDEEDDRREDGADKRQVFVLPSSGGEARRLTEAAEGVELFRWAADATGVYYLGPAPRPPAVRGSRRRRKDVRDDGLIAREDIPTWEFWFQPLTGRPRRLFGGVRGVEDFAVSPDGRWLAYATNHTGLPEDSDRTEIVLHELATGKEQPLTGGRGGAELHPSFSRDGRWLFFRGWTDPQLAFSRQELFAVEWAAPGRSPRPLLAPLDRDLEDFAPLPDGRVAVLVAWGMESRLALVDPASGVVAVAPLEGWALKQLTAARDADRLAAIAEAPNSPPEVGLIDPRAGTFTPLTDLNPQAADWRRAERRRIRWSNEGFEHEGLLLLPAPEDRLSDGPPPLVVWLHGGPHWRVVDALRAFEAESFAAEGWAVFLPQYRGSSGYAEAYQTAIRGDLGGAEARDILAGLDELGRRALVDLDRAAVGGASYGGYLTNWLLATTDRFRAGVSMAGIFDLAQDFVTSEFGSWELHYLGGPPWEQPDLYRERSPLRHAASLTAPLLILHGLEDEVTFIGNSRALHRALVAQGRTTEFVGYPREGHGVAEPNHRLDEIHRTLEWFARHVLSDRAPRLVGREVEQDAVKLTLLGHQVRREYNGVKPSPGRVFLELTVALAVQEDGPNQLYLAPAGPESDIVLLDERGDLLRPIGVPLDVHQQIVLYRGGGLLEAGRGETGRPPTLAASVVFEAPDETAAYRLRVFDLPAVLVQVTPPAADDDAAGA